MKQRSTIIALTLLAAGLVWIVTSRKPDPTPVAAPERESSSSSRSSSVPLTKSIQPETPEPAPDPEPEPEQPKPVQPVPKTVALAAVEEAPSGPEIGELNSGLTPVTVLENMRSVFRQYNLRFHENPVGDNAEITRILSGENPKHAVFLNPDDGMRVNSRGELVDNWGTPYFFHQLSRSEMEIRSAGPDNRMWTSDDLVMK